MRQHKVFLRHELLKYNSEKSTAKSSALENYISSANLSLSGCSSAEPNSVSVGRCKFQLKKLYLQTVKKVDHLPFFFEKRDLIVLVNDKGIYAHIQQRNWNGPTFMGYNGSIKILQKFKIEIQRLQLK